MVMKVVVIFIKTLGFIKRYKLLTLVTLYRINNSFSMQTLLIQNYLKYTLYIKKNINTILVQRIYFFQTFMTML